MQPLTSFHRSVQNLVKAREASLKIIALLTETKPEGWGAAAMEEWLVVDGIDRQIGVAYYWHQKHATSSPTAVVDEAEETRDA